LCSFDTELIGKVVNRKRGGSRLLADEPVDCEWSRKRDRADYFPELRLP
jgi:hypothetical protein